MRGHRRRPTPHLGGQTHHRNRYKDAPPDFYALGQQYPDFKQYLHNIDDIKRRASLAWDDPIAVRELTKTLLLHDFGLHWNISINRLCPPLPNRLNYIHWVEDLLAQVSGRTLLQGNPQATAPVISGIDVGTGANCIYALLGATMNNWNFIATEIDVESYQWAVDNVARNQLETLIAVKRTFTTSLLLEPLRDEPPERTFHFVMCNPPFFDTMNEADTNPKSSCMGSATEMVFPGGEVAFIERMITESEVLQKRVLWYTSMVGKKASLRKLLSLLREKNVQSTRTTEFFQGRTKRWGIAWTFTEGVKDDPVAKVLGKRKEAHRRQELDFQVPLRSDNVLNGRGSIDEVLQRIGEFISMKEKILLSNDTSRQSVNTKCDDDKKKAKLMYRLQQYHSGEPNADNKESRVLCAGRLVISDEGDGIEVRIVFKEGDRASFWTMAHALRAAIVRTGRQWRRKLQRQQQQ